jgi:hypothetical protein
MKICSRFVVAQAQIALQELPHFEPFLVSGAAPHSVLCELQSHMSKTGAHGGSSETRERRSLQFQVLDGGRYTEQTDIGSGTDMRQPTACRGESSFNSLYVKIGITLANFNLSGTVPSQNDKLYI